MAEGRQIDRYRIVEQIGTGGMSVVYKGVDTALDREVAVKVLHPHLAQKEDSRRRFSREARAVAKLHHPNILEIYDFSGDEAPESFIVTEYIRGHTLRAFAEKERFEPPEVAMMAIHELAGALDHAHSIGIIHRDLKPENVMIRQDGVVKLMDFGIAKVLDRDERMTMTGALVGSPAHMAPEIIEGAEAGREADIFSLGTILYWLCCQKLPFVGNNTTQTLKLILDGTFPDPRTLNAAVSDSLAEVIARCLARDPKERYATAGELKDALADALLELNIERPNEELAAFFADPESYRGRLRLRLVDLLNGRAEALVKERKDARALDCLNRVLALDATNERARAQLEAMKARKKRAKRLARAGLVAGALVVATGGGFGVKALVDAMPKPQPKPPEVVVAPPVKPIEPPGGVEKPAPLQPTGPAPADSSDLLKPNVDVARAMESVREAKKREEQHRAADKKFEKKTDKKDEKKDDKQVVVASAEPQKFGDVSIKVFPYAPISIDGQVVNPDKPYFEGKLPVGAHKVHIASGCCKDFDRELQVLDGVATPPVAVKLEPKPALLTVSSSEDVSVMVNDVYRGTSGASQGAPIAVPLPEGAYRGKVAVRFYKEGRRDRIVEEEFVAGALKTVKVELERP